MIKYLKDEKLEDLVKEGTYLVDFYADWCGPCKMLGSVLETMEDVNIIKINVDEHPELASKNGVETTKSMGFQPEESIRKLLD